MILTIRTDKPESELGLYADGAELAHVSWQAHRQLAETIHTKIQNLLQAAGKQLSDITGVVVYQGPGSFTGLRIGMSVANALAYGLDVPIATATGEDWSVIGIKSVTAKPSKTPVTPEYGAAVNITQQKK